MINLEFKDLNNFNYNELLIDIDNLSITEIVNIYNYNNKNYGDIYNYLYSKNINSNECNWPDNINQETDKIKRKQMKTGFRKKQKIFL